MRGVFEIGFQVRRLVEEDPEEEIWIEVAIDGNLMEIVVRRRAAVIAQLRHPFEGDMEMDFVKVQVVVYPIHR